MPAERRFVPPATHRRNARGGCARGDDAHHDFRSCRARTTHMTRSSPSSCIALRRDHTFLLQAAFALFALLVPIQAAFAQGAEIPPRDVYQDRGHTPGNKVALCVNGAAMMAPFEIALAREISSALLLTPLVNEIKTWRPTEPLDYRLPMTFEDIFIEFAERC